MIQQKTFPDTPVDMSALPRQHEADALIMALTIMRQFRGETPAGNEITGDKLVNIKIELFGDLSGEVDAYGGPQDQWASYGTFGFHDFLIEGPMAIMRAIAEAKKHVPTSGA